MKDGPSPSPVDGAPNDGHKNDGTATNANKHIDANTVELFDISQTPIAAGSTLNNNVSTYDMQKTPGGYDGLSSSCKRRRLISEKEEECTGISMPTSKSSYYTPRTVSRDYDDNDDDDDDDEDADDDSISQEIAQMHQESILKKIKRLNGEDEDDQLIHTTAVANLFEYIKGSDDHDNNDTSIWKILGAGYVKFIKCLEEGYNCGMIRMEVTKNGTLETLMRCELTHEEVVPMQSSKNGKAYSWRCKDFSSNYTTVRTFAIRFADDMDAILWKAEVESSKLNNRRVRRGLDIPDLATIGLDDICSDFKTSTTI